MTSRAVIAAGDPNTAQAGLDILRGGGNAVDAAVGASFAAFTSEPILTGPFGGGFAVLGGGGVAPAVYDFFAAVPGQGLPAAADMPKLDFLGVDVDFGATTQTFHIGRGAAASSAMLPGLVELHAAHGRLPLEEVVRPGRELASNGAVISPSIAGFVRVLEPILRHTPESAAIFAPGGELLAAGDRLINRDMADLLRRIGEGDPLAGQDALLGAFGPPHGRLTPVDQNTCRVTTHPPVIVPVGDCQVVLNPPPSSGGLLVAFGLRLLENAAPSVWSDEVATAKHLVAAMAITNEARAHDLDKALDDPDLIAQVADRFLSDENLDRWREPFERATVEGPQEEGTARHDLGGTTHISALDADGLACSITSSNGEGCGHVVPGCGAMANNFMGEDDLHPHGFHVGTPGKRLTSMMCPTVVLRDGEPVMVLGTGGSSRIRTALLQVLVHQLYRGFSIEDAVLAPRMHYEGHCLYLEHRGPKSELPLAVMHELEKHSHEVVIFEAPNLYFGGVHSAGADGHGIGDPRRGGVVLHAD